jgi:hypothetical protein
MKGNNEAPGLWSNSTKKSAHENERIEIYKNNRPKLAFNVPAKQTTLWFDLLQARSDFSRAAGYWIGYLCSGIPLTTAHTITAIETFIAGSATDGNMSAGIAGRRIALHAFSCCIDGIYSCFCFFNSGFY